MNMLNEKNKLKCVYIWCRQTYLLFILKMEENIWLMIISSV